MWAKQLLFTKTEIKRLAVGFYQSLSNNENVPLLLIFWRVLAGGQASTLNKIAISTVDNPRATGLVQFG